MKLGEMHNVQERSIIQEKIGRVMATLILHWKSMGFENYLMTLMTSQSLVMVQMSFIILKNLSELVFDMDSDQDLQSAGLLPDKIRDEWRNILMHLIPSYFEKILYYLSLVAEDLLLKSTLECCLVIIEWIPYKHLEDSKIVQKLISIVKQSPNVSVRLSSLETLIVLINRQIKPEERIMFADFFLNLDVFDTIVKTPIVDQIAYNLLKRSCQCVIDMGLNHLVHKKIPLIPNQFQAYLALVLQYSVHGSVLISSLTIPFWIAALKTDFFAKNVDFQAMFPQLLNFAANRIMKEIKTEDPVMAKFTTIDFESNKEYKQFISVYRSRLMDIIKELSLQNLEQVLVFVESAVKSVLSNPPTGNTMP
jgi:hypothetical protein